METSNSQFYKKDLLLSGCGLIFLSLFIFLTNPSTLPAVLLLLLPICVAGTSFTVCKLLLEVFTSYTQDRIKLLGGIIAIAPTLMVVLGSVGQLQFQDIVLAVFLIAGISWYAKRQRLLNTH